MEAGAGSEPDILFAIEQRAHRIRWHQRPGLFGRFAQRLLGGGRENGRHSGGERCAKSVSDGRLVQGTERRSEEHTSELQSLMRISYAVFCLKKHKKATSQQ